MAPPRRTGTGRKKIDIRRIDGEEARQVCFSKRRRGLFNKANELATLCDVEVAAVAFAPSGTKAFSFGQPSVESVLDRFLPSDAPGAQAVAAVGGGAGGPNPTMAELNRDQGELLAQLDAAKARKEAKKEVTAKARAEGCQAMAWLHTEVGQMGVDDLAAFEAALAKMHAAIAAHANQVLQDAMLGSGGGFDLGAGGSGTRASTVMEMMQQQEQEMVPMPMPPPTGPAAGMETTQQQMVAMPPGFTAGMETVPQQWFGPHYFPQ